MRDGRQKRARKLKKRRIIIGALVLVLALLLILFVINLGNNDDENKKKVVDEIKKFSYTVSDTDTKLFKDKFKELKKILSEKEIDNKEYAKLISELFIIDFYTLDNKTSKNDVGGVQFIYESYKADFVDNARDSIYKQVKSNLDSTRNQNLPEVQNIKVNSIEEVIPSEIFESEDFEGVTNPDAYEINLSWTYKNSDDFQSQATIIVVKDNDKLSIGKLE